MNEKPCTLKGAYKLVYYELVYYELVYYELVYYELVYYELFFYELVYYELVYYELVSQEYKHWAELKKKASISLSFEKQEKKSKLARRDSKQKKGQ